ncbi:hypothetical protein ASF76_09585 [Microbacterium sp. Leaf151]|nr:hypothetical protein ASF76_09585 [Microbacterium sp. Leaf151]
MILTDPSAEIPDDMLSPVRRLAGGGSAATVRQLRTELRSHPVDAVVALQNFPNLIALAATRGLRRRPAVLISERNITTREDERRSRSDVAKREIARRAYRFADTVIAISHPVAGELVGAYGVRPEQIVVVPNPAGRRAEIRTVSSHRSESIDLDRTVNLLLPMRLVPQKRATRAVEAAALLREDGLDVRVVCFGKGPLVDELKSFAEDRGVPLDLPGWTADWVASAPPNSVTVLPSYREGFGNTLVESAMGGIPCVAVSNAYGSADAMIPTVTGELAFSGDPKDIADAVRRVRGIDPVRTAAWARRFSSARSGEILLAAIDRARAVATPTSVPVLASAVGQYDNIGDTVLRRAYLDHLRPLGPLTVWVGDKAPDYLSGLGLTEKDTIVADPAQWRSTVSRQLLSGRGVYAFDTGETEVRRAFALRYLRLAPLLLVHRLRGGTAILTGVGVREPHVWRHVIAAVLRLCRVVTWRDAASRRMLGIGEVSPDWAFALGADAETLRDTAHERPLLAISVRQGLKHAARERPDDRWVTTVRTLAEDLGLRPVVVAQIERDGTLAEDLADRLGCEAITWLDHSHARQEQRLRETYRNSAAVVSDRLHAVVIAATEGAVPIALSTGPLDKTSRTLEGAGIVGTSVDRDLRDLEAVAATVRSALARREEIVEAVIHARTRLTRLMDVISRQVRR